MIKKKIKEEKFIYIPPPERWYFYIGEKYYRRLQVVPYKKNEIPEYFNKFISAKQSS